MVGVPNGDAKIRRKIGRCKSLTGADGILTCQVADNQCSIGRSDARRPLISFVLRVRVRTLQPKWRKLVTPSAPDTDYQAVAAVGSRTSAHTNGRTRCRTNPFRQCFTPNPKTYKPLVKISRPPVKFSRPLVNVSRSAIIRWCHLWCDYRCHQSRKNSP